MLTIALLSKATRAIGPQFSSSPNVAGGNQSVRRIRLMG